MYLRLVPPLDQPTLICGIGSVVMAIDDAIGSHLLLPSVAATQLDGAQNGGEYIGKRFPSRRGAHLRCLPRNSKVQIPRCNCSYTRLSVAGTPVNSSAPHDYSVKVKPEHTESHLGLYRSRASAAQIGPRLKESFHRSEHPTM
jgi:hypothetical protein